MANIPSMPGEAVSYMTILEPRRSEQSDIVSVFGGIMVVDEKVRKRRRFKFFLFTLVYSLGLGNIWRFPRQSLLNEEYACFIYLHILFNLGFGISLLFFEGTLGQYSTRGFTRTFSFCPYLEGITFSMIFYGIFANMFYNAIAAFSVLYICSSFHRVMPHSYYSDNPADYKYNFTHSMKLPEHSYFFNEVASRIGDDGEARFHWQIFVILIIIWIVIGILVYYGTILKYQKISMVLCIIIVSILFLITIISLTRKGANLGLKIMFIPNWQNFLKLGTWVHSLEQSVISLGLGSGPILTFWSTTKYITWSYFDLLTVNIISITSALFSAMIVFSAVGVIASEQNRTLREIFSTNEYRHKEDMQVHIIVTHLFNGLGYGFSNFAVFLFNFMFLCSFIFTAVQYTYTYLCLLKRFFHLDMVDYKPITFVCLTSFLFGIVTTTNVGFPLMMAIDKMFLGIPLLILIFCELMSVSYYYGLTNFCDDTEFLLFFIPGKYYQVCWMLLPLLFFIFIICGLYVKCTEVRLNSYDIGMLSCIFIFIILPIIVVALIRCRSRYKDKHANRVRRSIDWRDSHNFGNEISIQYRNAPSTSTNPARKLQ